PTYENLRIDMTKSIELPSPRLLLRTLEILAFLAIALSSPLAQSQSPAVYQERFMGLPQENADGYKAGSPINFSEGLQCKLLLVHGSGDDNVHYQGTEMLVKRPIEPGKPFDFMTYPGRTHALLEGPGTAFHLYCLLARYLEENLLPTSGTRE